MGCCSGCKSGDRFGVTFCNVLFRSFLLVVISSFVPFFFRSVNFSVACYTFTFTFLGSVMSLVATDFRLRTGILRCTVIAVLITLKAFVFYVYLLGVRTACVTELLKTVYSLFFILVFYFPGFCGRGLSLGCPCVGKIRAFCSGNALLMDSRLSS